MEHRSKRSMNFIGSRGLHADDNAISVSVKHLEVLTEVQQNTLNRLTNWGKCCGLDDNRQKTELVSTLKEKIPNSPNSPNHYEKYTPNFLRSSQILRFYLR